MPVKKKDVVALLPTGCRIRGIMITLIVFTSNPVLVSPILYDGGRQHVG